MAIQKLLPSRLPSGYAVSANNYYYNASNISNDIYCVISQELGSSGNVGVYNNGGYSLYSGSNISNYATQFNNFDIIDYLSKSISNPDDSSYLGVYSGAIYPSSRLDYTVVNLTYELCQLNPRGLKSRFRYSGLLTDGPILTHRYFVYNPNKPGTSNPYYETIAVTTGAIPTYTGDSSVEFATFETPSMNYGDSSWFIDVNLLDNLIQSGSHIKYELVFASSSGTSTATTYGALLHNPPSRSYSVSPRFSAIEIEASGEFPGKSMNMHLYSAPVQQSGGLELYTKRHGYINSIEEITVSGTQKLYPTAGTYANGSGARFEMFPSDYLTYREGTGYNAGATELIVPAYGGDNPMVNYVSEDVDSPNNTSYIGLTNHIASQSGHSNYINIAIGTQMTNLTSVPTSLTTSLRYSGYVNPLDYNIENLVSQYFLTLDGTSYYIGKADYGGPAQCNNSDSSFQKITYPTLYLDGRSQPSLSNIVATSGALLANLIASGATFSTYTTMSIMESWGVFDGYKNHAISAFNIEISGGTYTTYIAHPQLMISGAYPTSESGTSLYLSAKSGIDSNFNLYTSGDNQINSGLSFAMPSPSFAISDLPFRTQGDYLTSLNMYIENGTFKSGNKEVNLVTYNNYSSGEIVNNFNIHTKSYSGDYDDIYMYIGGTGSRSASGNFYLYTGSHNESFLENINLFTYNDLRSGNTPIDFHLYSAASDSGILNLYIGGDRYGLISGIFDIYMSQIPENSISAIPLLISNNKGYISGDFGNNQVVNFTTVSKTSNSSDINIYMLGGKYGVDSGNLNIFLLGDNISGYIPFYTHNVLEYLTKDISLNLTSYLDYSGDLPLHINGGGIDLRQGELTLVTRSAIANSGDVEMSIVGNIAKGPVNLYIKAKELSYDNDNLSLSTFSAFNSGIYNSFELSVRTDGFDSYLPMYIPASSYGETTSDITMVMLNDTTSNKDVFLYIENNIESKNANYTLFTRGNGLLEGGSVYSSSMNLFIDRGNESVYNIIPMALMGPSGINDYVPLVMSGGYISESGIYLSLPSSKEIVNKTVGTYIHGFLY